MMYLGNNAVGLIVNNLRYSAVIDIQVTQNKSYDEILPFLTEYITPLLTNISNGFIDIEFKNNTDNGRAGLWVQGNYNDNGYRDIKVMRVGLATPQSGSYGIDIYDGSTITVSILEIELPWR